MKSLRVALLPLFVLWLAAGAPHGFATPQPGAALLGKPKTDEADKQDSTKPPFKGMTKMQAMRYYGEPDSVGHRDGEELWTYVLNRGENYGRSFIPFNFNNKLRYRLLTFKDSKVVRFHWDPPKKD